LRLRDRTLQNVFGKIRCRRAFRLEHILAHIRHSGTRRNRTLQDIFAQVWLSARGARRADRALRTTTVARPGFSTARAIRVCGFSKFKSSKSFFRYLD
jgi:hypothetical protein